MAKLSISWRQASIAHVTRKRGAALGAVVQLRRQVAAAWPLVERLEKVEGRLVAGRRARLGLRDLIERVPPMVARLHDDVAGLVVNDELPHAAGVGRVAKRLRPAGRDGQRTGRSSTNDR